MRIACLVLALALSACGARSTLSTDDSEERDGGPRPDGFVPPDMRPVDFGTPDMGGPEFSVTCPPPVEGRPGEIARVSAEVVGDFTPGTMRWSFFDGPERVAPEPATGTATQILPPVTGIYELLFEATDRSGRVESCVATIVATGSLPLLVCPDEETVPVGETIELAASAFDEEGPVELDWRLDAGGRRATLIVLGDTAQFQAEEPGEYRITIVGTDSDGNTTECTHTIRAIAPPVIECPGDAFSGPTRQPLTVSLMVSDDTRVVDHRWEPISWPADDTGIDILSTDGPNLTMVPRRRGTYELRYTATDTDGLSSSCLASVIGEPTPPTLTCPTEVIAIPLRDIMVEAMAEDDGTIVRWRWRMVDQPMGSGATQPSPNNQPTTTFMPDIVGTYVLNVEAEDDDGNVATCTTNVIAVADEGLRIEMFWDTDGTDMDLHLLSPRATRWAGERNTEDCHFRNCQGGGVSWGGPGPDDDPSLDIDDTNGFGPENINVDTPENGRFRVGVHAWSGTGNVTVRIYCGGSRTDPLRTLGPVRVSDGSLWRVADVDISGINCMITDLTNAAGQPDVRNPPNFNTR